MPSHWANWCRRCIGRFLSLGWHVLFVHQFGGGKWWRGGHDTIGVLLILFEDIFKELATSTVLMVFRQEIRITPFVRLWLTTVWRFMSPWPCIHIFHTILSSFFFPLPFADHPDQSAIQSVYPLIQMLQSTSWIA